MDQVAKSYNSLKLYMMDNKKWLLLLVVIKSDNNNLKYNKLNVELSRVETLRWLIDCFRKPLKAGMPHQYDWYFIQNTVNDAPKSNETKNDSV